MTRFALRTTLASLVAAVALSAPGIAAAVPIVSDEFGPDAPSTLDPVVTQTFVEAEVAPTGDGSATEEDCNRYEHHINSEIAALKRDMLAGSAGDAEMHAFAIEVLEDMAQDAGCFVVY